MSSIKHLFFKKGMLPIYLIFNVTYRCNSKCITCFAWRDLKNSDIKKELNLEEIRKLSSQIKNIEWLLLSGGEPFLREEIGEICEIFYRQNKTRRITIPTNGLDPEKISEKTEEILKKCKDAKIVISLAMDDIGEKHDKIRGVKGNFVKLLKTYQYLSELKRNYRNLSINLNTVLFNLNIKRVGIITDYVLKNMRKVDFHGFELLRGLPRDSKLKTPSWQEYEEALKTIKEYWKNYGFYKMGLARLIRSAKILARDIELDSLKKQRRVVPCFAGSISGVIGAYGDVQLCELLPKIGNLRESDYDFNMAWFSKNAEFQRKLIKKRENICRRCTHSCFVASSILFDPFMYPKLLKYMIKH